MLVQSTYLSFYSSKGPALKRLLRIGLIGLWLCSFALPSGATGLAAQAQAPGPEAETQRPVDESDAEDEESQAQNAKLLAEVRRLRQEADINIVMDYDNDIHWNPLYSYSSTEAQIHIALFEGLLSYNPIDMTPRPGLAESWQRSTDGLRYTFSLRRNARFSDGSRIDANTIAETWLYLIRSSSTAPFSSLLDIVAGVKEFRQGTVSREAVGITVNSPYELEIALEHPSPEILAILCHHSLSPLPPSLLVEQDLAGFYDKLWSEDPSKNLSKDLSTASASQLISNGPYQLQQNSAAGILLKANPYYWNAAEVQSSTIFIQKYYDWQDSDISKALDSYKIDWISSGFSNFAQLSHAAELIHVGQSFSSSFFYFASTANKANPWSNSDVRKALTLLLPLKALRSSIGGDAHLIPEIPKFNSGKSIEKQDKEEALRLLEQAGYPEGQGLGTLSLYFSQGSTFEELASTIQEAWSILKCDVEVHFRDPKALLENQANGEAVLNFTLGILSWIGDYPDPTTFLNLWRSGSSLNLFQFRDPVYDELLNRAQQQKERSERLKLLAEAEEYLLLNAAVIPLWHSPSFNLYNKDFLDGFYENVLDLHPLQTLRRTFRLPKGSV